MTLRLKVKAGERIKYQGFPCLVLEVKARSLEIRDKYGFVKTVKKSEVKPWRG